MSQGKPQQKGGKQGQQSYQNKGGQQQGKGKAQQGGTGQQVAKGTQAPRPPKKESPCLVGYVHAVLSGDSVVIIPMQETQKALKELNFTLTGLKAPTVAKKTKDDQPYGWESREYLRTLLIGKIVVYKVEHEIDGVRVYGDLWLNEENVREKIVSNGWADVTVKERKEIVDKDGKVLPPREPRYDEVVLLELLEAAKKAKKGIWKNAPTTQAALKTVRNVKYHDAATRKDETDAAVALFTFFEAQRGKPLSAVVEQVRSGSSLRLYVPATQDEITVNLSGVISPIYRFGDESASQAFSREAKFFTEFNLLNRNVTVTLETLDKSNNLYGTVIDTAKQSNIGTSLLKLGLASFVEWNCPAEKLREWQALEETAKTSKLRIWAKPQQQTQQKSMTTSTKSTSSAAKVIAGNVTDDEFSGVVVEVLTAGSLVVRVAQGAGEYTDVTVAFSSIRVPRLPRREKVEKTEGETEGEGEEAAAPIVTPSLVASKGKNDAKSTAELEKIEGAYAKEGKDFLRKELIGKRVNCVKDYVDEGPKKSPKQPKASQPPRPPRAMYSVYQGKANVALKLVRKGYARASFLAESDPRSVDYKEMVLAEKQAEKDKVGLHAPSSKAPTLYSNDISFEGEAKCKHFLGSLQRVGKVPAVVEYNFSPSRFKLHIPSQHLTLSFAIKGILSEKPVRAKVTSPASFKKQFPLKDEEGSPIASNIALHYTRDTLFQRDVFVTIEDIDMQGTFFGALHFGGTDFAAQLVEQGHGKLHHRSAERLPNYTALKAAEEKAKTAKKGLWWNFDAAAEQARLDKLREERAAERSAARAEKGELTSRKFLVTVTEIMTGSNFFFQIADQETKTFMEDLMEDFQGRGWEDKPSYTPVKKGEWVAGKFTVDNSWYRAQVLRILPPVEGEEKQFELRYLDYGNSEIVGASNIRQLDEQFTKTPAQAHKGKLAYIKAPHLDAEFGDDSAILFKELVWGKTLLATLQFQDDNVYHVMLGDEEAELNINGALVVQGLASLEPKRKAIAVNDKVYSELRTHEQTARTSRLRIWHYGVVPDSDEERQWASMLR